MRRAFLAVEVVIVVARSSLALADAPVQVAPSGPSTATATWSTTPSASTTSTPTPTSTSTSTSDGAGVAVIALPGADDAAWPLARSVYGAPSLRPLAVDETRARVLCGEAVPADAPSDVHDLAATVAALRGDDAPSRALLADIARRLALRAVLVVRVDADQHASARVFVVETGAFDAATYTPDDAPTLSWSGATRSVMRTYGRPLASAPIGGSAPAISAAGSHPPDLATHEAPRSEDSHTRQFYESGWFWGALGAAAFAGGAVFLATRDSSPSTIHLQIEVPH